ncbi:MAG: hypothetical protein R3F49_03215 [Planctomycetota bacterium]
MSARFRIWLILGFAVVLALHAPRCFDALAAPVPSVGVTEPAQVAALEPLPADGVGLAVAASGSGR